MTKLNKLSIRESNELDHFNKISKIYDHNYGYNKPFTKYKIEKKVQEFVNLVMKYCKCSNPVIVELGCGTGEYTQKIAKKIPEAKIIGIDISDNILNLAKKKCRDLKNIKFLAKSAYETGLKKESADVICGFYALHHFDVNRINEESQRVIKKGGLLFFYEPNILNPLVYLIKSSVFLKKKVGDSPDEWAINPISISKRLTNFKQLELHSSEFMWPVNFLPLKVLIAIDRLLSLTRFLPVLNKLGGSLVLCYKKK